MLLEKVSSCAKDLLILIRKETDYSQLFFLKNSENTMKFTMKKCNGTLEVNKNSIIRVLKRLVESCSFFKF